MPEPISKDWLNAEFRALHARLDEQAIQSKSNGEALGKIDRELGEIQTTIKEKTLQAEGIHTSQGKRIGRLEALVGVISFAFVATMFREAGKKLFGWG